MECDGVSVVDAHNDLLLELDHRREESTPFERVWLPNLERGCVDLQVCPLYGAEPEWLPELSLRQTLRQVAAFYRAVAENRDQVVPIRSARDLDGVGRGKRIGLMMSMEGVEALGYDPLLIDVFWQLGVRMVSLTWNRRNPFAEGLAEPGLGGLSRIGHQLVDRMIGLGMILDLAHASERTFADVLECSGDATVVVSHAACRAVCETPRNLSDDQLRALAERGGVLGIMLLPLVIDPQRLQVDRVVDHIDHAVQLMGVEHVGLGGDFIAQVAEAVGLVMPSDSLQPEGLTMSSSIYGLRGPEGYPTLIEALRRRGYSDDDIRAIAGDNLLRLLRQGLPT